ncbi:MAG: sensor histidine kinase, partial [Acidimicrobiales bacterium]
MSVVALVAVGLVVADAASVAALRSYLIGRVDQQLALAYQPVAQQLLSHPTYTGARQVAGALPGTDTYAALISPSGQSLHSFFVVPGADHTPAPPTLGTDLVRDAGAGAAVSLTVPSAGGNGPAWRVLAQALPDNGAPGQGGPPGGASAVVVVGASLTSVQSTLARLELIEGLATAAVLLGVGLAATWLVRLGLRPLDRMGETAGAIAAGDLSRRVEETEPETEVGRLGLALNAMLAQIESAFTARQASEDRLRRFVADASHELRTPLTSIRGYAELFRRGAWERPEDLATAMRRIEEESIRMGGLVEDLLLLARLDQGRPLERSEVDLAGLASDAVADARAAEPERPVELAASDPVMVVGDEARLRQVTANLLANARRFTFKGISVRL